MSSDILDDEEIIQARIRGESVRSIAKRFSCTLPEVHKILDRFAETTIDDKTRKHSLALELERLDQLQQVFSTQALQGDAASAALVAKIIERRCTMLGLYAPPATTLQVIEAQAPKETSTEKIRRVLDELVGKHRSIEPPEAGKSGDDKLN